MRKNLPDRLVTLNLTKMCTKLGEIKDWELTGLLVDITSVRVTIITTDGNELSYDIYPGLHDIDDKVYCSKINYIHDDDEVQDFQLVVQHCDMEYAITQLAAVVLAEFKNIIDVVPEDHNELWNLLQDRVFPKPTK